MKKKTEPLTERELRSLPNWSKVFVKYQSPEQTLSHVMTISHGTDTTFLDYGAFGLEFDYTGNPDAPCRSEGPDGDVLEIFPA